MKNIFAVLIVIAGIIMGAYLGLWVCFVGGIIQIIEALKATPIQAMGVAFGLLRVISAGLVGWGTVAICGTIGVSMLNPKSKRRTRG